MAKKHIYGLRMTAGGLWRVNKLIFLFITNLAVEEAGDISGVS